LESAKLSEGGRSKQGKKEIQTDQGSTNGIRKKKRKKKKKDWKAGKSLPLGVGGGRKT